jgi:5-methylcytosine-specific restriction endonuclease McrA
MAKMDVIARHPLAGVPYDSLEFVKLNPRRVPLYRVRGQTAVSGAFAALGKAFEKYGGTCFYCGKQFNPHRLAEKRAHREHVIPKSAGGSARLHNLVIACTGCGSEKANQPISRFKPEAADDFSRAIEKLVARALGSSRR